MTAARSEGKVALAAGRDNRQGQMVLAAATGGSSYAGTMAGIRPSETSEGHSWLSNFDGDDKAAARRLLDGLRFLSEDELRSGDDGAVGEDASRRVRGGVADPADLVAQGKQG